MLTSTTEVSFISGARLVRLGLIHLSLSGLAGFPCWLVFVLLFFFFGARLQAAEDSTVASLDRFPELSGWRVGASSDGGNFFWGVPLSSTPA